MPSCTRGTEVARDVAAGRLDLDDLGTEVGQQLGRVRARDDGGEVDHPDAVQWQGGHVVEAITVTPHGRARAPNVHGRGQCPAPHPLPLPLPAPRRARAVTSTMNDALPAR